MYCDFKKLFFDFLKILTIIHQNHGDVIPDRSNNSYISNETSAPQQAGGFITKYFFGILNNNE